MRWVSAPIWTLAMALSAPTAWAEEPPLMKFNEVREIAPGVFFRYASISATDPKVPFGGCNNIWVVFEDYVVVIDANFPKEAAEVLQEVRRTTDKPIRYVVDTHHHGDHAYGNAVWAQAGATVVAQQGCFRLLTTLGPQQFKQAGLGATGRPDVAASFLKMPSLVFDDKLVFDDGRQRVELLYFGHMHTAGDAVAYMPRHRILCTGDACVNGAFNFMGHSDTASWIRGLERMEKLAIRWICPGHGPIAGREVLALQKRYFVELREQVQKGIAGGKSLDDIVQSVDMPWYVRWTGKEARLNRDNIEHVYKELTGKIDHSTLGAQLDRPEGPSYWRGTPGWQQPQRIVVPYLSPARLAELRSMAPGVYVLPVRTYAEAVAASADADAVLGFAGAELITKGKKLKWIHLDSATRLVSLGDLAWQRGITLTSSGVFLKAEELEPWQIWIENVRRFARGDKLTGVVAAAVEPQATAEVKGRPGERRR
ncbi:MAG: hypothetical protein C4297_09885 [Gemmataceae bacterium]